MKQLFVTSSDTIGPILISDTGQRRLPVFECSIRQMFVSVASMTQALAFTEEGTDTDKSTRTELELLLNKNANFLVSQLEAIVGELDQDHAIIYEGTEGGFVCGSAGKIPTFISQESATIPTMAELISGGVIDKEFVQTLEAANKEQLDWIALFESPVEQAKAINLSISDRTASDLNRLAPSRLNDIKDPDSREFVEFFHAVVKDGRYLDSWQRQPSEIARRLGFDLSDSVLEKASLRPTSVFAVDPISPIIVTAAIVVAIAVTVGTSKATIQDRSGLKKF